MNALHEGEGKEKDSAKETARPRGNPRGTRKPEPLLNQPEAAAESCGIGSSKPTTNFIFVALVKRTEWRLPITGPA